MAGKLSFSIAVNLLTENFKKGANTVKDSFRSMQMQIVTFAAALGAGGVGLMGLITRLKDTARETSRAITALKNVSGSTRQFADNLKFANDIAKKYGLEVNALIGNYAKFTASATQANMPMEQQKKVFESLSRASTAFGLSADDTNGVFLALSQIMGKGKISSEELRKQMGERIPIAMQAMAKAAGVSMAGLEKLLKQGKLMSADIIPKFADALNEMIPNVDTDNLETSLNRMSNMFTDFTEATGFKDKYKVLIDSVTALLESAGKNIQNIIVAIVAAIVFVVTNGATKIVRSWSASTSQIIANSQAANAKLEAATAARVEAEISLERAKLKQFISTGNAQVTAAKAVAKAQTSLSIKVAAEHKAQEIAKAASSQAAAVTSSTAWGKAYTLLKVGAAKLMVSLKSMWNTFAPAIIISAIVAIAGYFKNIYDEAQRIKNIFSDFKKEAENVGNTQEVKMLQTQLSIMNDKTRSQKEINEAQAQLNKMLGVEGKNQKELNSLVADRIKLLRTAAQADFYARKSVETEDKIGQMASNVGLSTDQAKLLAKIRTTIGDTIAGSKEYFYRVGDAYRANGVKGAYDAVVKEIAELMKVVSYADDQLKNAVSESNKSTLTASSDDDPSKKKTALQKSEEKYTQNLNELNAQLELNKQSGGKIGITQQEYNKALDELNIKTLVDAKGTGNKALLNSKYLKNIEEAVKHPLYNKEQDEIEKAQKDYNDSLKKINGLKASGAITEEEYNSKLQDLVNSTIELTGSILGAKAMTNDFFKSLSDLKNSKLQTIQNDYNNALKKLTDQHNSGAITDKEYVSSMQDLIDNTVKLAGSLLGADAATNEWYKKLLAAKSAKPEKIDLKFNKEADDIISDSSSYQEAYKKLSESAMKSSQDMLNEVNKLLENPNLDLSQAMKIAQTKIAIKDLRKELNEGLYTGVKDIVSGADGIVSSFERLGEVMSDVDASGWEKIMAVWDTLTSTIDGFLSIISAIEKMTQLVNMLAAAKKTEAIVDTTATATKVANATKGMAADTAAAATSVGTATTEVAANQASAISKAISSVMSLPFPVNILAVGGAIATVMALFSQIPKFANGGIIQGSPTGDLNLARVNGGEMILNGSQQKTMFDLLNKGVVGNIQNGGGNVTFTIEGTKLVGVLNNTNRKRNRMN